MRALTGVMRQTRTALNAAGLSFIWSGHPCPGADTPWRVQRGQTPHSAAMPTCSAARQASRPVEDAVGPIALLLAHRCSPQGQSLQCLCRLAVALDRGFPARHLAVLGLCAWPTAQAPLSWQALAMVGGGSLVLTSMLTVGEPAVIKRGNAQPRHYIISARSRSLSEMICANQSVNSARLWKCRRHAVVALHTCEPQPRRSERQQVMSAGTSPVIREVRSWLLEPSKLAQGQHNIQQICIHRCCISDRVEQLPTASSSSCDWLQRDCKGVSARRAGRQAPCLSSHRAVSDYGQERFSFPESGMLQPSTCHRMPPPPLSELMPSLKCSVSYRQSRHAVTQIANRIKAKGLQKLRWYCQMCGKQCRDENGFKCHLSSDSHQRQMMVFGQVSAAAAFVGSACLHISV